MDTDENITTEELRKRSTNQFDLVNELIKLARIKVMEGQKDPAYYKTENPALQAIEDRYDEIEQQELNQ